MSPEVTAFFDEATNVVSYVARDPMGSKATIIDSMLDFNYAAGRTANASADDLSAAPCVQVNMRAEPFAEPKDNGGACPKAPLESL
jgi:hypothetical protein